MNAELLKSQLTGEYREVFERAQTYIMMSDFEERYTEDKLSELFDLLLTAQSEQKPVTQLVGRDVPRFLNDYFSDHGLREHLLNAAETLRRVCWVVLVISLLNWLAAEHPIADFFTVRTDIIYVLGGIIGGLLFVQAARALRPAAVNAEKNHYGLWCLAVIVVFVLMIMAESILIGDRALALPVWMLLAGTGAYLLVYYTVQSICRLKRYGTVRDTQKALYKDAYYQRITDMTYEKGVAEGMLSQYRRLLKRGKITEEGYLAYWQEKHCKSAQSEKYATWFLALFTLAAIAFTGIENLHDGQSWVDTAFFALIIITMEYFIWRFFGKIEKRSAAAREHILTECAANGQTLPAYLDELVKPVQPNETAH